MLKTTSQKFGQTLAFFSTLLMANAAHSVYLNIDNITVAVGASHAGNPFVQGTIANGLENVIDAPTAEASEFHIAGSTGTHVWAAQPLELDFDLGTEYDLTTLHFWNYWGESFDVDNIAFTFFDSTLTQVGVLDVVDPFLGGHPLPGPFSDSTPLTAQDYLLAFPSKVQYVNALLTGSNGQVDFNNIGFTGRLSICEQNPTLPECQTGVPEPTTVAIFGLGLGIIWLGRRRSRRLV